MTRSPNFSNISLVDANGIAVQWLDYTDPVSQIRSISGYVANVSEYIKTLDAGSF